MHEIITLQLGQQANYVGTHFWNAQESYFTYDDDATAPADVNHDVNFRSGIGADGSDTYTPRALIYDLKGGFGAMRKVNALYEAMGQDARGGSNAVGLWDHQTTTTRQPLIEQVQYQKDLDGGVFPPTPLTPPDVRYWSDFNRVYFHPRSAVQISEYELDSQVHPFERYDVGKELFRSLSREHELLDRDFRLFAEECDQMQGVQVLTSVDDAWGGFAGEYVEELRDEYGKLDICVWGMEKGSRVVREKQAIRSVALAKSLATLVPLSTLYIPLQDPPSVLPSCLHLDRTSLWHTSALLATAFETATLPTRVRDRSTAGRLGRMDDMAALLNVSGNHKIAQLSMLVAGKSESTDDDDPSYKPDYQRMAKEATRLNCSWDEDALQPRGTRAKKQHVFVEASILRGFSKDSIPEEDERERPPVQVTRITLPLAFPSVDSFPSIIPAYGVDATNVTSAVRGYSAVATTFETSAVAIARVGRIRDAAAYFVGVDEREALTNELDELVDGYHDGWNSDDEFDEDS